MTGNPIERTARWVVLAALTRGPRAVPEMSRAWPVTRALLRAVVARLAMEGAVEPVPGSARRLRLTECGRRMAAALRAAGD
jgi:hypothetical protein